MRWQGIAYRAHDPRWSWAPISGEGAASKGGRFNPKGVPALYLALSVEGMLLEMGHGFAYRLQPLTICSYDVDVDGIVDLRAGDRAVLGCPWALDVANGRKPPSWTLAEKLITDGAAGMLAPSFARGARNGMSNLVLWRWDEASVKVHDPERRLPRDTSSWRAS